MAKTDEKKFFLAADDVKDALRGESNSHSNGRFFHSVKVFSGSFSLKISKSWCFVSWKSSTFKENHRNSFLRKITEA